MLKCCLILFELKQTLGRPELKPLLPLRCIDPFRWLAVDGDNATVVNDLNVNITVEHARALNLDEPNLSTIKALINDLESKIRTQVLRKKIRFHHTTQFGVELGLKAAQLRPCCIKLQ